MTLTSTKLIQKETTRGNGANAPPLGTTQLDEALAVLQAHKDAWVATGIDERIALLAEIRQRMAAIGERWVGAILAAKGTTNDAFGSGEEWANYALVLRWMRLLHGALRDIRHTGRPRLPGPLTTRRDGRAVARIFPQTLADRLLFMGVTGEVWMAPGITQSTTLARQALAYQDKRHSGAGARKTSGVVIAEKQGDLADNVPSSGTGQVTLLLGAGNAGFMAPDDALHQLFVADRVVLLKLNPVNAYLGPLLEEALQPLVVRGVLRIVAGGPAEGAYLCSHPAVDTIHLTGSDKTFEAILFGCGAEGQRRKAERRPLLDKPITAELGNVTPIIVVPGPWRARDIREQAVHLATWLVLNAGCNCISERVIVQQRGWPLREALLQAIGEVLAGVPTHLAYYPGASARYAACVDAHPNGRRFGNPPVGHLPWTLIPDVNPNVHGDLCFTTEAFCSLVAETALPAANTAGFLDEAVDFANHGLWGTLGATIIIHPRSLAEPGVAAALERAISNLHYGTISINHWVGYAYYFGLSPWGAAPGSDIDDIQSGMGMVNNALMLEGVEKTVYSAPFHKLIDPYTVRSRRVVDFGRKMAAFDGIGAWRRLLSLVWTSARCWSG